MTSLTNTGSAKTIPLIDLDGNVIMNDDDNPCYWMKNLEPEQFDNPPAAINDNVSCDNSNAWKQWNNKKKVIVSLPPRNQY